MINPAAMLKIKGAWDKFSSNHPKFPMFLNAMSQHGIKSGNVIELKITDNEGQQFCTNVKLTDSDMELFELFKSMGK